MGKGLDKITLVNLYDCEVRLTYLIGDKVISEKMIYKYVFGERPFVYVIINDKDVFIALDSVVKMELLKIKPGARKKISLDSCDYQ